MEIARVGKPAPDFTAPAYIDGRFETVTLSSYLGKWTVLCFYPGDFTFVLPTELAAVAAVHPRFVDLGVEFLAVSTDSHFVHKIWHEEELGKMVPGGVPFPMLSDSAGHIGRAYGVYDDVGGIDVRGRFLIDPDGIVQAIEMLTPPVGRNVDELERQIRAYQLVRESRGARATPAGWRPGETPLAPGPHLVGKVWTVWKPRVAA